MIFTRNYPLKLGIKYIIFKTQFLYLILFVIAINCSIYFTFKKLNEKYDDILLESYLLSVSNLMGYDLDYIDRSSSMGKQILLLQNPEKKSYINDLETIISNESSNFLFKDKSTGRILIDLQPLKEVLNKMLPSYINHQIVLNNSIINFTKNNGDIKQKKKQYELGNKLKIILTLDSNSDYVKNNDEILIKVITLSLVITLILSTMIIRTFFRRNKRFYKIIKELKNTLSKKNQKIKDFADAKKAKNIINAFFFKKASEAYTKDELEEVINNNELKNRILKKIGEKDYIFPLILKGKSNITLQVDDFFYNLEKSLKYYMFKSKLNINIDVELLNIGCDREVFYQIVFSLTVNLLDILEDQSDKIRYLNIRVLKDKIVFVYEGYPLSRDNMIKLSSNKLFPDVDVFLLTGSKLFQSIDYHNIKYNIISAGFKNTIELLCYQEIKTDVAVSSRIVNFPKKAK